MRRLHVLMVPALCMLIAACTGARESGSTPRRVVQGAVYMEQGLQWYGMGCYRQALVKFLQAREHYSLSDMLDGVAMSLNNIGTVYRVLGDHENAIAFFDEAREIYSDLKNNEGTAKALSNKAATLIETGQLDLGERALEEALAMASEGQGKSSPVPVPLLQNKGVLLTRRGQYEEARVVLTECLQRADSLAPPDRAALHFAYGNLMLMANRPREALSAFKEALALDKSSGFHKGTAEDLFYMGKAYVKLDRKEEAVKVWKRSVKIYALIDFAREVGETMEALQATAREAGMDISVTKAFVQRWREGRLYESPCSD